MQTRSPEVAACGRPPAGNGALRTQEQRSCAAAPQVYPVARFSDTRGGGAGAADPPLAFGDYSDAIDLDEHAGRERHSHRRAGGVGRRQELLIDFVHHREIPQIG